MPAFMQAMAKSMPQKDAEQMEAIFGSMGPTLYIFSGLLCLLAIVSAIGAVQLLKRRRSAITLLTSWAIVRIIVIIGSAPFTFAMQQRQMEAMKDQPGNPYNSTLGDTFLLAGAVFNMIWYLALPVFALVWFQRNIVKSQYKEWS